MSERERVCLYLLGKVIGEWMAEDFENGQKAERLLSQIESMSDYVYWELIPLEEA